MLIKKIRSKGLLFAYAYFYTTLALAQDIHAPFPIPVPTSSSSQSAPSPPTPTSPTPTPATTPATSPTPTPATTPATTTTPAPATPTTTPPLPLPPSTITPSTSATTPSTTPSTMPPSAPSLFQASGHFPSTLLLDGKEWVLQGSSSAGLAEVAMYFPRNQSANNVGEQIIIKKFNLPISTQINPATFGQGLVSPLQAVGFQENRTVIESSPQEAIISVSRQGPGGIQGEDLQRIVILPDKKGLVIIQYSVNKMDTEWRNKWVKILKNMPNF